MMMFAFPANPSAEHIAHMESVVELIEDMAVQSRLHANRLERLATERPQRVAEPNAYFKAEPEKPSHLYLMRHDNGLTKVGRSVNPRAREKTLQAEDPRLRLLHVGHGYGGFEYRIHNALGHRRVRGEWFDLAPRHVDWIQWAAPSQATP